MRKDWSNIMKVLSKLNVATKTILTLDGDVLGLDASKVIINGEQYDFDIAYDLKNTIGINGSIEDCNEVTFMN